MNTIYKHLFNKYILLIYLLAFISFLLKIIFSSTSGFLNPDAFVYLVKTKELLQGDFRPILTHSFGLPIISSLFFFPIIERDYLDLIFFSKLLNIFYNSIIIIPIYFICLQLKLSKKTILISILFFIFYPTYYLPQQFMSENIFTFFFLFVLLCVLKYQEFKKNYYLLSLFLIISFCYYIKPTGLLLYFSILFFLLLVNFKNFKKILNIIYFSFFFWLFSLPFLIQRFIYFGSPFTYGNNDNYFLESYTYVWADNIDKITLLEFILNSNFIDIIDKFIKNGFFKIIFDLFLPLSNSLTSYSIITPPIILIFFFVIFINNLFNSKYSIFIFTFIFWVIILIPIYEIFGTPRHLEFLIPIIIILSSIGISKFLLLFKQTYLINFTFIFIFIFFNLINFYYFKEYINTHSFDTRYIKWIKKNNISGNFATIGEDHILMMHYNTTKVALKGPYSFYDNINNIYLSPLGYFENSESAINYYKSKKINYLLLYEPNHWRYKERPFLNQMLKDNNGIVFEKIFPDDDKYSQKVIYKVIY